MPWTRFMDMHSGGGQKEAFAKLYIEAPRDEAESIFYVRFGHNPERVTCTCCGSDYSIDESETLEEATRYDRVIGHDWSDDGPRKPLDEYLAKPDEPILVIRADEIAPADRAADVPEQGYVWRD